MFLFWGPDLICFYNDAYRPSLGNNGKHPSILGMRAEEGWSEIWHIIYPLIEQVMTGGEATWSEDQLIPIFRNGKIEDVYWTFSYSPVKDESGKVGGVFVTCNESTSKVLNIKMTEASANSFRNLVMQAPVPTAVFKGADFVIELANDEVVKLWGKDKTIIGKKILDALPELQGQPFIDLMMNVYTTGVTYQGKENMAMVEYDGELKTVYFNLIYKALYDNDTITGLVCMGVDVTEQVTNRKKLEELAERTRLAIDANEIGVYDLNILTNEVTYSDIMNKIYDVPASTPSTEYVGMIHPDDLPTRAQAHEIATKTGKLNYQFRIILKNGNIRWIETHGKIYYNEDGTPVRRIGTIQDITEKKRVEQIIEESEKKFRTLSDVIPQHIWTSDAEGNLNYFNKSVYTFTGLDPADSDPKNWLQIVHPDDRDQNVKAWLHSVSTGKPFLIEHRFRRYDGEYCWQLTRAVPVRDSGGSIQMWVGSSTDIDEIKKHEQQKDDFIKMASHELKTPVTTIKGYVQLLMEKYRSNDDSILSGSLTTIDKQVTKLTKLITDLLDVTKIETGSFILNKESFSINELITDISNDVATTTATHSISLELEDGITVVADKDRISQVLLNLLANGIKYSPKTDKIIVKTQRRDNEIIVSVIDFGIGIPMQDHQNIFERFYRVEGKDENTFPGFGIGLFIVKEFVTLHQGRVWVESKRNNGSAFHFTLPLSTNTTA